MEPGTKKYPIVTLDGPACAGKGTMAKYLSSALDGFAYLDTGMVYRAMALAASQAGFVPEDMASRTAAVIEAVEAASPEARFEPVSNRMFRQVMWLDGKPVYEPDLRTPEISEFASVISTDPGIRRHAGAIAHRAAEKRSLIVDGRDAGTALFPDAEVKFFLWAPLEDRAARRQAQELKSGTARDIDAIRDDIKTRDLRDSTRADDPLRVPPDAIWVDTGAFLEEGVKRFLKDAAAARLDPGAARII